MRPIGACSFGQLVSNSDPLSLGKINCPHLGGGQSIFGALVAGSQCRFVVLTPCLRSVTAYSGRAKTSGRSAQSLTAHFLAYPPVVAKSRNLNDKIRRLETGRCWPWLPESVRNSESAGSMDHPSAHQRTRRSCFVAPPESYCSIFACCRIHC